MMKLTDKFRFGKFRGATLEQVLSKSHQYVEWCIEKIEWFELDKEAEEHLLGIQELEMERHWDDGPDCDQLAMMSSFWD